MENAANALLIAAGVLIGLMIISLGITLFSSLSNYTDNTQKKIEENAIQKFNEQFIRFINCEKDSSTLEFTLTIQDIVTAANTAYESNLSYGVEEANDNNYYVTINMTGKANLEKNINTKTTDLLQNNIDKEYRCTIEDVKINTNTGRVCEVNFTEIIP